MEQSNQTNVQVFILLGLSDVPGLKLIFFVVFFIMYVVTLSANFLLIIVVQLNPRLQTPMYFFLTNLSIIDICFSSTVVPRILVNTISQDRSISFLGCAAQMYFHLALGGVECLILTVMAFDRYTAICKPLQYNRIMSKQLCLRLAIVSWMLGFQNSIIQAVFTFQLPFCKSNVIDHFFCEIPPLLRLSCKDIYLNELSGFIATTIFAFGTFLIIFVSYFYITLTILKTHTANLRKKAFSTCASHITVVSIYYGTIIFMHLRPQSSYFPEQDRAISIIYTVVTPMVNPIIYSIRNKDIKGSIRKTLSKHIHIQYIAMKKS
ncbi:olfactory receptor 2G3-like [Hyperolius riggenbachi]|uniref:olfactory receptor 2G3-like n=1 Tax=Hyperolius riggenbachi TaxID=752182 RepID=UPI0035A3142A